MLDLLKIAKEMCNKDDVFIEENIDKKYIGYVSWRVEFMTSKKISKFNDAKPFFYMMQRSMPYANFDDFFVDVYNPRDLYHRPEWDKLVEKCKDGQIDMIVIPSIQTLSSCMPDIVSISRKLKELPKPVYVYFMADRINSEEASFEMECSLLATMYQEQEEINKKKRKMMAYIKEGKSKIILMNEQGNNENKKIESA